VLIIAFVVALVGCLVGLLDDRLIQKPGLGEKLWMRHIVRPVAYCTVPYLCVAASLTYFGHDKLMGGFGFYLLVVAMPLIGAGIAWRRHVDPAFNERFERPR